jgi:hypothetical protein
MPGQQLRDRVAEIIDAAKRMEQAANACEQEQ